MTSSDGETNQGGTLFKGGHYCYKAHLVVKVTRNHTITDLPHRGTSPLPDGQMEAIIRGIISNSPLTSD